MTKLLLIFPIVAMSAGSCHPIKGGKISTYFGTNHVSVEQAGNANQPTTQDLISCEETNTFYPSGTVISNEVIVSQAGKTTTTKSVMTFPTASSNVVKKTFEHKVTLGTSQIPVATDTGKQFGPDKPSNKLKWIGWSLIILGVAVGGALAYFGMLYLGIKVAAILTGSGIACVFVESLMVKYPTYFGIGAMLLLAYVIYDHVFVHKSAQKALQPAQ